MLLAGNILGVAAARSCEMPVRSRVSTIKAVKAIAAVLILEILVFALGAAPVHLAAVESHHDCTLCALIHHPPILSSEGVNVVGKTDVVGRLHPLPALFAVLEPAPTSGPTRAPPSYRCIAA